MAVVYLVTPVTYTLIQVFWCEIEDISGQTPSNGGYFVISDSHVLLVPRCVFCRRVPETGSAEQEYGITEVVLHFYVGLQHKSRTDSQTSDISL